MKTAISIIDEIYRRGEKLARKLKISRSELYSRALQAYFEEYYPEDTELTNRLNEVYPPVNAGSSVDPVLYRAQLKTLSKEEW